MEISPSSATALRGHWAISVAEGTNEGKNVQGDRPTSVSSGPSVCRTLVDAVRRHAAERPHATALASDERCLTYDELELRSGRIASGLRTAGNQPGARVAYLGKNRIEFFEILVACMKIGAVAVPLNWRLSPPEIGRILSDMRAQTVFVTAEFVGLLDRCGLPSTARMIIINNDRERGENFDSWLATFTPLGAVEAASSDDIAIQVYSSGTTGTPKGAMLSHRAYHFAMGLENVDWPPWCHWSADEVALVSTPLFHVGGVNWGIRSLFFGAMTYLTEKFDAGQTIALVQEIRVTRLPIVPASLRELIDHPAMATADFSSIRHMQYGASPIDQGLLIRAVEVLNCDLVQTYGLTETTFGVVALNPEDHAITDEGRYTATGRPLPGVSVRIVSEEGSDLPALQVGEVLIRSPSLMSGYWRQPNETAKAIDANGWLHTGDAGHLDENGYLFVKGRLKEVIITGGENVFPGEVENALVTHPSISEVAVIGRPSVRWGEEVVAIVVPRTGGKFDVPEILRHARGQIAGYKLPKSFALVDELPRNAGGKIIRRKLSEMIKADELNFRDVQGFPKNIRGSSYDL